MTSSAIWQLAWGLVVVLVIFLIASGSRRTIAIGVLLVLLPFQVIDTQYASSSVLMAYALAAVLLLGGSFRMKMTPTLAAVVMAYLISLSQANRDLMTVHVLYLFQFFSCLVVFLLAYNFARSVESVRSVITVLLIMNVLILGYCALQFVAGPGQRFIPFGIDQLAFNINRTEGDPRLVGPFGNPGSTSGYFMLAIMICAVEVIYSRGGRRLLAQVLIGLNLIGLVATANRASFLVLIAMFPAVLFAYRKELGVRRVLQFAIGGIAVVLIASLVAIHYTRFGTMFDRMATVTQTEGGVPHTRVLTWPVAIAKIKKHPWLGEGPFFVYPEAAANLGLLMTAYDDYPHSLYLFLLRTVGVVGLVAVLWFFLRTWLVLRRRHQRTRAETYESGLLRLGLLLIPAFLIAQISLEFNRPTTMDYAQFIFALMGLFLGVGDHEADTRPLPSAVGPTRSHPAPMRGDESFVR